MLGYFLIAPKIIVSRAKTIWKHFRQIPEEAASPVEIPVHSGPEHIRGRRDYAACAA